MDAILPMQALVVRHPMEIQFTTRVFKEGRTYIARQSLKRRATARESISSPAPSSSACSVYLFRCRRRRMSKFSPVSYKRLVKVFEAKGFACIRTFRDRHFVLLSK